MRRVPLAADGHTADEGAARCLLTHMHSTPGSPLDRLVTMLARLDDLAHVLLWSAPEHACADASDDDEFDKPTESTMGNCYLGQEIPPRIWSEVVAPAGGTVGARAAARRNGVGSFGAARCSEIRA